MNTTFVIFRSGISGGTATLSIRLGEYLIKIGYDVIYICNEFNDLNNVKTMENKGIKVCLWSLDKIDYEFSLLDKKCNYCFLTYSLEEFLFVEKLKKKLPILRSYLYVVHHYALTKGINSNRIIREPLKLFYRNIIIKLVQSKNIIFMDSTTIAVMEEYYGIKVNNKSDIIFNLPINIKKFDCYNVKKKSKLQTFNLLTIARAEFPFKGYLIGLIDDFKGLCNIYDDITLTIITFGNDKHKVDEKIKKLPRNVQDKINLIGQTPYEELNGYFNKTHLYLGMGTTILDAVNNCVPALLVQQYTYNSYSSGFFHMQPNLLVGLQDSSISLTTFVKKVKQMNYDEYELLCKKEHDALAKCYSIESFINWLELDTNEDSNEIFTRYQLITHQFMMNIKSIINRLSHK